MIVAGLSLAGSPVSAGVDEFPTNVVEGDVYLDLGSEAAQPSLGRGWSVAERSGRNSYRWMNGLEADLTVTVKDGGPADLWIRARPLYLTYTRQRVAVYVNGGFVSEWTCPRDIDFAVHCVHIPAGSLKAGANQVTLRAAYRKAVGSDKRRLSLCVDRFLLRRRR
jgi:hypothetical protein